MPNRFQKVDKVGILLFVELLEQDLADDGREDQFLYPILGLDIRYEKN